MYWLCILATVLVVTADAVQHFQVMPKDTSVVSGKIAVLECVIGDRKGAVQWTKDGFSLGFNRTIPGYDRYSVTSRHENEFNLKIVNASLEDDAVYECQVLPRGGDDRLQARATLTVLVPCEPPVILGYRNNSLAEVSFEQKTIDLVCEARNGRPAATIEWFRNGIRVTEKVKHGTESNSNDKTETATSTITVSLTNYQRENGIVYRCQAKNSASEKLGLSLNTSVTLSILSPPGKPVISGYSPGHVLNINDTLVLTCISTGGNPLGTVAWYRNGQPVDWSFNSSGGASTNQYNFSVRSTDNDAVYKCQVTNLVAMTPLTEEYKLKVKFPPTSVKISGPQEPVEAGDITLTCVSSNSNPQATITWFKNGNPIPLTDTNHRETPTESPEGGYITKSELKIAVVHNNPDKVFTCKASNPDFGQTVTDTLTLSVIYPPSKPDIQVHRGTMKAGDRKSMSCQSVGGNPIAQLKWYKGTTWIKDAVYKSLGNVAISEIAILLKPNDNGAVYKCTASNLATTTPLEDSVRLAVIFPPSQVTITVSPAQPKVGDKVDLVCTCSSSNPAAEIMWLRNGRRVGSVNLGTVDAEFGGKNTTNRLQFTPTSRDHNAVYSCRATNRELEQNVNDAVTLDVLFPPEFDTDTLPVKIDIKKGEGTSLNLTAYANPSNVTYQLYKEGVVLDPLPPHFKLTGGVLNISNAKKGDRGSYMINGTNNLGSATFNFYVNVKYAAEIVDNTKTLAIDEGDSAVFSCKFDANPVTPDLITWSRENFDMSRTMPRIEGNVSYLSVSDLTREDSGTFKCVADNRMGTPVTKFSKLLVRFAPVIDKSPEISRSAGEKGSSVTLRCVAKGAPNVSISWTRNNNPVQSGRKYKLTADSSKLVNYESMLLIKDLEVEDYGAYVCTATNIKGSDSHSITLTGTSKPNPPYNIEFINATSNSITISWKSGFDGGLSQSFRVRYKPVTARGYVYVDVRPFGATTFRIKGLELDTEYELTVLAFNDRGESVYQARGIVAKTSAVPSPADISTSELQGTDEIPVIIILVVCIVGVFILTLNVGLILFFIKRRKKRMEGASETTSHNNTFELYSSTKGDHNMYPSSPDDAHSYGTNDKSMDDFSDDYIRDYDRECETHMFLPSQHEYPGSRPYSPHKLESPMTGSGHKMTYIIDDHPGHRAPWSEDHYRSVHPRHKKGVYENGVPNGDIYEFKTRGKGMNELSESSTSRPSSRSGKTPPPPPTRCSSRGGVISGEMVPPLPHRNYDPQEISPQPRYGPTPGSSSLLSPNIVANPTYTGPHSNHRTASPHTHQSSPHRTVPVGAELRGHLV